MGKHKPKREVVAFEVCYSTFDTVSRQNSEVKKQKIKAKNPDYARQIFYSENKNNRFVRRIKKVKAVYG